MPHVPLALSSFHISIETALSSDWPGAGCSDWKRLNHVCLSLKSDYFELSLLNNVHSNLLKLYVCVLVCDCWHACMMEVATGKTKLPIDYWRNCTEIFASILFVHVDFYTMHKSVNSQHHKNCTHRWKSIPQLLSLKLSTRLRMCISPLQVNATSIDAAQPVHWLTVMSFATFIYTIIHLHEYVT